MSLEASGMARGVSGEDCLISVVVVNLRRLQREAIGNEGRSPGVGGGGNVLHGDWQQEICTKLLVWRGRGNGRLE